MPQPPQQITPPIYEDDPDVMETFVDGPVGVNFVSGNMHLTFFTVRLDHRLPVPPRGTPSPQVRRVTHRLVLPLPGAIELRQTIDNMLQILREQGLMIATPVSPGPSTRQ